MAVLKSDLVHWASPQSIQGVSSQWMGESMITLGVDMHHLVQHHPSMCYTTVWTHWGGAIESSNEIHGCG